MSSRTLVFILILGLFSCETSTPPPLPFGAVPAPRQLAWHNLEFYAFVHFNMNTFTDMEWGTGAESPAMFNPTALDCRQWAKVCSDAGMKGIILTAKHHDGFCLWDSQYTEHDVANSPWKSGKGDVVRELSEACKEYGLKFGIYLSPWDRNHADYGKPEYITYFRNQLKELLTNYGDIFEVWFDGANGGTGYYGGANEERKVDRRNYYDWPNTYAIVRELMPGACMFSDNGPDIRWIGTEKGFANPTNWSTLNKDNYFPGTPNYEDLLSGNQNGTDWVPGEVDVSIRPGWYYHPKEDTLVKSADHLELIYYNSVGRNASLLINLPVDKRGLVHENDVQALEALRARLDTTFGSNLASKATIQASLSRGAEFGPENLLDGNKDTYWAAKDDQLTVIIDLTLEEEKSVNVLELREYIPLGQRIEAFTIEALVNGEFKAITNGTTIGNRRWLRFPAVSTTAFRIKIDKAMASPVLAEIGLFFRPHSNTYLDKIPEINIPN